MSEPINRSKNKQRTVTLTILAVFVAIEIIMAFTPLGSLPFFWGASATLAHLPILLAALVLAEKGGLVTGVAAGLLSLFVWTLMPPTPLFALVFSPTASGGNFWSVAMSVIPWILTGLLCAWIYRLLNKVIKNRVVTAAIAGGIAYAFRVFLVLGGIVLFFSEPLSRNFGGINICVSARSSGRTAGRNHRRKNL